MQSRCTCTVKTNELAVHVVYFVSVYFAKFIKRVQFNSVNFCRFVHDFSVRRRILKLECTVMYSYDKSGKTIK